MGAINLKIRNGDNRIIRQQCFLKLSPPIGTFRCLAKNLGFKISIRKTEENIPKNAIDLPPKYKTATVLTSVESMKKRMKSF